MVRVSVRISREEGHLETGLLEVEAECIARAVEMVEEWYPGAGCEVVFPLDPERFFADGFSREDVAA